MTQPVTDLHVVIAPSPAPLSLTDCGSAWLTGETNDNGAGSLDPQRQSAIKVGMTISEVLAVAARRGRRAKRVVQ